MCCWLQQLWVHSSFFPLLQHLVLSFRTFFWCHKHTIPQLLLSQVSVADIMAALHVSPAVLNSPWGFCSAQNQYSGAKLLIRRKNSRGPDTWTWSRNECNWAGHGSRKSTGTKSHSGGRKERGGSREWSCSSVLLPGLINVHLHSIYAAVYKLYSCNFPGFLSAIMRTTDSQPKCLPHIIFPSLPYPLLKDCAGEYERLDEVVLARNPIAHKSPPRATDECSYAAEGRKSQRCTPLHKVLIKALLDDASHSNIISLERNHISCDFWHHEEFSFLWWSEHETDSCPFSSNCAALSKCDG